MSRRYNFLPDPFLPTIKSASFSKIDMQCETPQQQSAKELLHQLGIEPTAILSQDKEICIVLPDCSQIAPLLRSRNKLQKCLQDSEIIIRFNDRDRCGWGNNGNITTQERIHHMLQPFTIPDIPPISFQDLQRLLENHDGAAAAVSFFDNQPVTCNNRLLEATNLDGSTPSFNTIGEWLRYPHSANHFPPGVLHAYNRELLRQGRVNNYTYPAFLVSGQAVELTVDANAFILRQDNKECLVRAVCIQNRKLRH